MKKHPLAAVCKRGDSFSWRVMLALWLAMLAGAAAAWVGLQPARARHNAELRKAAAVIEALKVRCGAI